MLAKVLSAGVIGIQAYSVVVEVDVALGLPAYHLVGLAAGAVKEGAVRVQAALAHSGFKPPPRRITINLAPADVRKDGAAYDLPTAVGILAALEQIPIAALDGWMLLGELSLDGRLRRVAGVLPAALHARKLNLRGMIVPRECAAEAAIDGLDVRGAESLAEVAAFLRGEEDLSPATRTPPGGEAPSSEDLADVRGLETARRALEVAAAGGHNLLFIGPPGSGKSMLARRLSTILPPLTEDEALETTAIYSVAGKLQGASRLERRPFRAPHHDVSVAGLVGGGSQPRPGEISLAHHGVLFLDELLEFQRSALEALRQPLEERSITLVRANASTTFPASFMLVAALNPCPCGYRGSPLRECTCSVERVRRYLGRLSGPVLDRIDLHVEVPHVDYRALCADRDGEPSTRVRNRVQVAHGAQLGRNGPRRIANALLTPRQVRQHCRLDEKTDSHLERCVKSFGLNARAVHRILRVARTIADLAQRERIERNDLVEAIALRTLDRPIAA